MLRGENRAVVLLFGFGNHSLESALPLFLSPSFSVTHARCLSHILTVCCFTACDGVVTWSCRE